VTVGNTSPRMLEAHSVPQSASATHSGVARDALSATIAVAALPASYSRTTLRIRQPTSHPAQTLPGTAEPAGRRAARAPAKVALVIGDRPWCARRLHCPADAVKQDIVARARDPWPGPAGPTRRHDQRLTLSPIQARRPAGLNWGEVGKEGRGRPGRPADLLPLMILPEGRDGIAAAGSADLNS
jgi:hypothetical protein